MIRWWLLFIFGTFIITQILPSDIIDTNNQRNTPKSSLVWISQLSQSCTFIGRNNYWLIPSCQKYPAGELVRVISKQSSNSANNQNMQKRLTANQVLSLTRDDDSLLFWYSQLSQNMMVWRQQLLTNFWVWLGRNEGSLLFSFVFGGTQLLEENIQQAVKQVGLTHMVAASGLQVGILATLTGSLIFGVGRKPRFLVQVMIVWFYAWISLLSASVIRATAMASLSCLASLWHRKSHPVWLLFSSGLILFLVWPALLFSPGFQLSFMASLGLLLQAKNRLSQLAVAQVADPTPDLNQENWAVRFQHYCLDVGQMSLVATVWTAPLSLYYFGQVSLWSVISTTLVNWLALPLFNWGLLLTVITTFSSGIAIFKPVLVALVWPAQLLSRFFIWTALFFNQVGSFMVKVDQFPLWAVGFWYLCLWLIYWWRHRLDARSLRLVDVQKHLCLTD